MYESKTADAIRDELLLAAREDVDKREGSILYDVLAMYAQGGETNYVELDTVLALAFAPTSAGYFLELRAAERGVERKEAVAASGEVTFNGEDGLLIPAGTRLVTADAIYFATTADVTLTGGTGTVEAVAEVGGLAGNVAAGKIAAMAEGEDLAGVTTVTNAAPFSGGADVETDEDLLERYLEVVRRPATSGNANEYKQWAQSIAGIDNAKVYPIWNGPGTVKVVLLGSDGHAPPADKVTEVADYIETVRPVGATVTTVAATEVLIDVGATLTIADGFNLTTVQAAFETAFADYLREIAFTGEPVRYSRVAALLLAVEGVLDYTDLLIEGAAANVPVADGSVAVKGAITFA